MSSTFKNLLKKASILNNKKLAIEIRMSSLASLVKTADQYGVLQNFKGTDIEYDIREHHKAERGGKAPDREKLYGVGLPDHKDSDLSVDKYDRSLSTRYSPDRVGVQAKRISDGVYQDPITNKIYDWNDGFKTEDGEEFSGSNVSLQTDIIYR